MLTNSYCTHYFSFLKSVQSFRGVVFVWHGHLVIDCAGPKSFGIPLPDPVQILTILTGCLHALVTLDAFFSLWSLSKWGNDQFTAQSSFASDIMACHGAIEQGGCEYKRHVLMAVRLAFLFLLHSHL
jgi:hypothetical protein